MRSWLVLGTLAGGVLLSTVASAARVDTVTRLIRQGRYRQAVVAANRVLADDPDDADAMAAAGTAWARTGFFADALGAFGLCQGSATYEDVGIEAHADALRAIGRGEDAAALRRQRLLAGDIDRSREMRVILDIVDDLRAAGLPEQALDVASEAEALLPNSPMVLAVTADAWLDLGELDQADWYLARSLQLGGTTRGDLVAGRRALIDGDAAEALRWVDDAERFRSGSIRIRALEAEAYRRVGRLDDAVEVLGRSRARLTEDPELMSVRLRVLADIGDWDGLADGARRARSVYGENTEVARALTYAETARAERR